MALHTAAVRRGAPTRFLIGDLPFLSFRKGVPAALDAVAALMRAGAQAVKLEGVAGHEDVIEAHRRFRRPGHGPSRPHAAVGQRARRASACRAAREDDATRIVEDARRLEALGCFSIVLECVPSALGARITAGRCRSRRSASAPASHCDGQVLVLQDLLGLTGGHRPKFVRTYLDGNGRRARCDRPLRPRRQAGRLPRGGRELRRMKVVESVAELVEHRRTRGAGATGFVPTLGALHEGHLSLRAAREGGECARLGQHLRESRAVQRSRRPRALSAHGRTGPRAAARLPAATSSSCRARTRSTATAIAIA